VWEAGENITTALVSRKRRQEGNPVSNETVRYGLKFCGTWNCDDSVYKAQEHFYK
jgi:hypothetical protein